MPRPHPPSFPPIPEVNDLIDDYITRRHRGIEELLERGRIGHTGEGAGGPLTPRVTITPDGIEVERPTYEQWTSLVDWHTYCRTYGYRHADLPTDAPPPPPKPSYDKRPTVLVRWNTIRDRHAQSASGQEILF